MSNKPTPKQLNLGFNEFSKATGVLNALSKLKRRSVLVGIPSYSDKNNRTDTSAIPNARIGFINEFGDPRRNIPARPFLRPSIREQQKAISAKFKAAGKAATKGDAEEIERILQGLALSVPAEVQAYILRGLSPPLSPITLANRNAARLTKSQRDAEIEELMRRAGVDTGNMKDTPTDRLNLPLVNTGQLLRSIEGFVVGKK